MPIESTSMRFMDNFANSDHLALIVTGAGAAFLAGLGGSPHCALMCGPLACVGLGADGRTRRRAALAWQAGRYMAYAAVGLFLGAVGRGALVLLENPVARALPWVMALGLVASAFEVGRKLPAIPGLRRLPRILASWGAKWSPASRAALRGMGTPFLPCGLLYGAFVMALGTGTPVGGVIVMGAFAAGAIPALVIVQFNAGRFAVHPRVGRAVRMAAPLMAAAFVAWRALHGASGGEAPHCH